MAKIFDFSTGSSFEKVSSELDNFHDWVVTRLELFCAESMSNDLNPATLFFDLSMSVFDPYERFATRSATIEFVNVESISVRGLNSIGAQLSNLSLRHVEGGIELSSDEGQQLFIKAERAQLTLS